MGNNMSLFEKLVMSPLILEILKYYLKGPQKAPTILTGPANTTGKTEEELLTEARDAYKIIDPINEFNIAFVGPSGVGKSSLINAVRGLSDKHTKSAMVGEVETSFAPTCYEFENVEELKRLKLWDFPGAGTLTFPAADYFLNMKLYAFDAVVIVGSFRFSEIELAIAAKCVQWKKVLVFVHSKMDQDINNHAEREDQTPSQAKETVKGQKLNYIRGEIYKADPNLVNVPIFLVSSRVMGGRRSPLDYGLDEDNFRIHLLEKIVQDRCQYMKTQVRGRSASR